MDRPVQETRFEWPITSLLVPVDIMMRPVLPCIPYKLTLLSKPYKPRQCMA